MDGPRRPEWDATVRLAQTVTVQMDRAEAFTHLAAVHEARRLLRGPERAALLDALAALERELGLAIGAEPARTFLRGRRRGPERG
jgi:hypothetical protein